MFTPEYREEVREKLIQHSREDKRIVSAAAVGSYAGNAVDRWSDIDLTFGYDPVFSIDSMLNSWTEYVSSEFSGVPILDISRGSSVYRVFIFPGCLQVDLSFTPQSDFGSISRHFSLIYGSKKDLPNAAGQSAEECFGFLAHHLLRVRVCVERGRLWQAEFWLSEARNYALKLCCLSRGLNTDHGRGFDDLPQDILEPYKNTLIKELTSEELAKALSALILQIDKISPEICLLNNKTRDLLVDLNIHK